MEDEEDDFRLAGCSFTKKLFDILQDPKCSSIITWTADGFAFEVKDPKRLETDILPKYFRHGRFQSLVRQLNFYSFKKISKERSSWIYSHEMFQKDRPELLEQLRRKTNSACYSPSINGTLPRAVVQKQGGGGGGGHGHENEVSRKRSRNDNNDYDKRHNDTDMNRSSSKSESVNAGYPRYNRSMYSYDKSKQNSHNNMGPIASTATFLTEIASGNFTSDGGPTRQQYPVLSENAIQNWDAAMRFFHHGKAEMYLAENDGDAPSEGSTDSSTNSSFGSSKLNFHRKSALSAEPMHMYPFYSYELLRSNSRKSSSGDDKTSSGDDKATSSDQDKDRKSEGDSGGDSDGQQQDTNTVSSKSSTVMASRALSIISDAEATASLRRQLASITSSLGGNSENVEMFLPFDLSSNMSANSLTILILFLLQRNPWYGSQYLFSNVYSLLTRNKSLLDEIDLYDQAMFPNTTSLRTAMNDYSESISGIGQRSSEEEESSSEDSSNNKNNNSKSNNNDNSNRGSNSNNTHISKRQRSFIQSNEVNIMRTFMTFSVSCAQQISLALEKDEVDNIICDLAFKKALKKCTESWWTYLRLYI